MYQSQSVNLSALIVIASQLFLYGLSASAGEPAYPDISREISIEIDDNWTYRSDDPTAEFYDPYPTVTLGTNIAFTKAFFFNFEATMEPVEDSTGDRAFKGLGGYHAASGVPEFAIRLICGLQ